MTATSMSSARAVDTPSADTVDPHRRVKTAVITLILVAAVVTPGILAARAAEQGSASFGDNERVGRNSLSAARLDIEIGAQSVPISSSDLAPGDLLTGSIELVNEGTVPLRYSIVAQATGGIQERLLAQSLEWQFFWSPDDRTCDSGIAEESTTLSGRAVTDGAAVAGDPATGADPGDRILQPDERDLLCIEMSFALNAPNTVQATRYSQGFTAFGEQLPIASTGQS